MTTTVNYQSCRDEATVDAMDAGIDKQAIKESVQNGMYEMGIIHDDPNWSFDARINMAGYVNYWYSNVNWIKTQYDKLLDQMQVLARQENGTEIHMEKVDKLVYLKKVREASLERAEAYYNESKAFYEKVTGEKYQPYSNKKNTGKNVTKEYALAKLQEELKSVKK